MDASTKLPNGMLNGNIQDLGSFDECLSIEGPQNMFTGQMCLVQTSGVLPAIIPNPGTSEVQYTCARIAERKGFPLVLYCYKTLINLITVR